MLYLPGNENICDNNVRNEKDLYEESEVFIMIKRLPDCYKCGARLVASEFQDTKCNICQYQNYFSDELILKMTELLKEGNKQQAEELRNIYQLECEEKEKEEKKRLEALRIQYEKEWEEQLRKEREEAESEWWANSLRQAAEADEAAQREYLRSQQEYYDEQARRLQEEQDRFLYAQEYGLTYPNDPCTPYGPNPYYHDSFSDPY